MGCDHYTQEREGNPETDCYACKCEELSNVQAERDRVRFELNNLSNARHEEELKCAKLSGERDNAIAMLQEATEARDKRSAILTKIQGFVTSGLDGREPSLYEMRILEMIQIGMLE